MWSILALNPLLDGLDVLQTIFFETEKVNAMVSAPSQVWVDTKIALASQGNCCLTDFSECFLFCLQNALYDPSFISKKNFQYVFLNFYVYSFCKRYAFPCPTFSVERRSWATWHRIAFMCIAGRISCSWKTARDPLPSKRFLEFLYVITVFSMQKIQLISSADLT